MMLGARTAAWAKSSGGGDFVPVEWIESTGLQAIDTGVVFDKDVGIEAELCYVENYGNFDAAYGVQNSDSTSYNESYLSNSGGHTYVYIEVSSDRYYTSVGVRDIIGVWHKSSINVFNDGMIKFESQLKSETRQMDGFEVLPYSFTLFCVNSEIGYDAFSHIRMKGATMTKGTDVIHSFVPGRIGSVGCLLDTVSGEFFHNCGTGAFIIGPDKTT